MSLLAADGGHVEPGMARRPVDEGPAIKSVAVGGRLLETLAEAREPLPLKELAARSRMAPSKARRYLASFVEIGLVVQNSMSRRYSLGRLALRLGLAALASSDVIKTGRAMLAELRDRFNETFVLSVWNEFGPTVVGIEESSQAVIMTMRLGAVLPLLSTSTGLVFAAYLPPVRTEALIDATLTDPASMGVVARDRRALDARLASVRAQGYAYTSGHLMPGISALAVPIIDETGTIQTVIAAMGRDRRISPQARPELIAALRAAL